MGGFTVNLMIFWGFGEDAVGKLSVDLRFAVAVSVNRGEEFVGTIKKF